MARYEKRDLLRRQIERVVENSDVAAANAKLRRSISSMASMGSAAAVNYAASATYKGMATDDLREWQRRRRTAGGGGAD